MKKRSVKHHNWWMKLDNAAKIYPAVTGSELTGVFRVTAYLTSPVKLSALEKATMETAKLFPAFSVELCKGFFWYYLEFNGKTPRIHADTEPPCQAFPLKTKGELMYRILTRNNTVSVEFLHVLTDGGGALFYLKTLLNHYCTYAFDISEPPFPEVTEQLPTLSAEDYFTRFYDKSIPKPPVLSHAWHLPFRLRQAPRFRTTTLRAPADKLYTLAKEYNATITEFVAAVFLFSLQEIRDYRGKGSPHIRIQVPFDLRRKFNAPTLRNFSLFILPEIDTRLGHYPFDEILQEVQISFQFMNNEKRIKRIISRNVSNEKNPFIRIIPLIIKSPILRMAYNKFGPSQFTSTITNIGRIIPAEAAAGLFHSMSVTPPPPHKKIKVTCGMITLGNNTIFTFGSLIESKALEQRFVKFLTDAGIPVSLI